MMNEQVRRIMTTTPMVAHPNEDVHSMSKIMRERKLHQIPVVKFRMFIGIFSLHDLWDHIGEEGIPADLKIKDVMNTRVVKISPLDKVGTAAELFLGMQFKSLPVVNLRDELKGVITIFDILKHQLLSEYNSPILFEEAFTTNN